MKHQSDNLMEAYTIQMLKTDTKKGIKYFCSCWFLLFSLGITIASYVFGVVPVFNATNSFEIMLTITVILIGMGYVTVSHDLKQIKKKQKKVKISQIVMIVIFLYISMYTEVLFFVIDSMVLMANAIGTEEMKEDAKRLGLQAQITGIFVLLNYPIFFKGKEIWKWITIRDEIVDEYEKNKNYSPIQT